MDCKFNNDTYMIGDRVVSVSDDETKLHVGVRTIEIIPEVLRLLTKNTNPAKEGTVSEKDVSTYLDITMECILDIHPTSDQYKLLKEVYGWMLYKSRSITTRHYIYVILPKSREERIARVEKAVVRAEER